VVAHPGRRLVACSVLIIVVFGALAVRVAQLQVLSGNHYKNLALRQTVHTVPIAAQRGTIFDRDGRDLALSIELSSIYADPQLVTDAIAYAGQLAPILGVDDELLEERLGNTDHEFEYLKRRVGDDVVDQVMALGLPGVGTVPEQTRQYPAGALASSLIGEIGGAKEFGGPDVGLTGLEYQYEELLRGQNGEVVVERDQQGQEIPNTASHRVDARRGTDIVLTIDEPLQWETEQSLIDQVTATNAKGGMAVVIDVTNGDVLSLASIEGRDTPGPARPSGPTEQTQPLTDLFEPGSTNKLITLATAIERGIVGPHTEIDVPSALYIGDAKYADVDAHGDVRMSVTDIVRTSSNIGTIKIAQHLSNEVLADALRRFGLGRPTSVDFPGQPAGLLLSPDEYYDTGLASTAIGYGVAVTAMQMLDVYVTIANNGVTRPPHLLAATIDPDGNREPAEVRNGRRVVSAATANQMTDMLTGVVSAGTGACAAIPGYSVAGKTGTARKAVEGGYSSGTMASFIGYAPAKDPRLAAIVVLDEPTTEYGGLSAAPVFSDVMQFALTRNGVAPDDSANAQYNAAQASAAASGTECIEPAAAARQAEEYAAAQAAAAQAAATTTTTAPHSSRTTGPRANASPRRRTPARNAARVAPPPDSLPVDTSQSG
jgi:cell division protein FtsI (penicillin-binding protein 3)